MAKEYKVGERYYLPVTVFTTDARSINPIGVQYVFAGNGSKGTTYLDDCPDLLLTAEEIYASRQTADKIEYLTDMLDYGRKKYDEIEELKARNAELEALLKEVMATRDEAIKQNNELIADRNNWKEASQRYHDSAKVADAVADELRKENTKLKADCNEWKDTANERLNAVQTLSAERNKVMAGVDELKNTLVDRTKDVQHLTEENANLKAWYEEANRTATEAAEANDDLKAKIADLRNRVGEQLAQIQDLNAEVHFFKADRDKFAKNAKDKADLANKACDERNDAQGDLVTAKAAIDYLQEENKKLKQELKDAEASYNVVAETSIKRKNRITTMEGVIVALVEKIRRLESDD